ncbi:hypothetical protein [Bradyrhizobium sp. SZCCHNR1051]|uniref:hypothetical protein n=1 Tax=Bradyrhizobium sp. SZCCHNR1051 TaxID=3057355 RepID=UPI0029170E0F|nr:hypothetical protein [Bradyrhizobium sp. SZCCHNR1051]
MNRDAMHEGPEIVDQGASVVVGTGVARHPFRQRVDGRDMAIQGCRMQGHRDGGFRKRGPFRLDTLSSPVQLCNALPLALDPIALRLQSRARCGRVSGKPLSFTIVVAHVDFDQPRILQSSAMPLRTRFSTSRTYKILRFEQLPLSRTAEQRTRVLAIARFPGTNLLRAQQRTDATA